LPPSVQTSVEHLPHTWVEIYAGWLLLSRGPCSNGFEEEIRKGLADRMGIIKDFLFTDQLRWFTVLNPGLFLRSSGEGGATVWGKDPVHPLQEG
jgi:hypothetical protein